MDKLYYLLAQYQVKIGPLPHVDANHGKVQAIMSVVFTIIGAIAVLMFVLGGLRYISAQGDPQEIAKAKSTLIYSIIGLVVSIMAVSIVTFILGEI